MQHVSSWATCAGFDQKKSELLAAGHTIALEWAIPSSGVRLACFNTENDGGTGVIFEIADLMEPGQLERVTGIRQASETRDGENSVVEVTE